MILLGFRGYLETSTLATHFVLPWFFPWTQKLIMVVFTFELVVQKLEAKDEKDRTKQKQDETGMFTSKRTWARNGYTLGHTQDIPWVLSTYELYQYLLHLLLHHASLQFGMIIQVATCDLWFTFSVLSRRLCEIRLFHTLCQFLM